jgi:hypothetical protein
MAAAGDVLGFRRAVGAAAEVEPESGGIIVF